MTTIEPGVVERLQGDAEWLRDFVRHNTGTTGHDWDRRGIGERHAKDTASLLALLAQQQARIGEMEGALNEIGREQSATTAWAAADRFQLLARAALPCETKGVEDLEAGCCAPCRARAQLALATKEPT